MKQDDKKTNDKESLSLVVILKKLKKHGETLAGHLGFIVVIIMLAIIGFSIAQTSKIIGEATTSSDGSSAVKSIIPPISSFNKTTIEQINNLSDQTKSSVISLPGGRINPFSE